MQRVVLHYNIFITIITSVLHWVLLLPIHNYYLFQSPELAYADSSRSFLKILSSKIVIFVTSNNFCAAKQQLQEKGIAKLSVLACDFSVFASATFKEKTMAKPFEAKWLWGYAIAIITALLPGWHFWLSPGPCWPWLTGSMARKMIKGLQRVSEALHART